eukprot:CAMPEP_0176505984 /NCGR_PEP_ID=MMETSP0200_2-20121128/16794_1 /TAXON_ID=947934 /ORGANISM="Chaetoceros sp., Strain GSL56" /LENGTH=620 /DNA_ID=CAMNT_0017905591 /DNA_START=139 /DNA_END=1998 /DNA_ORIENTATION=+
MNVCYVLLTLLLWSCNLSACQEEYTTKGEAGVQQNRNSILAVPVDSTDSSSSHDSNHNIHINLPELHDSYENRKGLRQRSHGPEGETAHIQWWPWHNDNNSDNDNTVEDNRCRSHENCTSCTESSYACHWCSKDNQCHAKGSWYGCTFGDTCSDDNGSPSDKADTSCHSHKDCAECTLSSSLCHFCAFDNQCHAIGSVYGCSYGVNCYSNDRCQRTKPEPIVTGLLEDVGVIPLVLILSVAMGVLCCSSILYAGANALQGAYDDLVRERVPPSEAFVNHGTLFRQFERDPILEDSGSQVEEGEVEEVEDYDDNSTSGHDKETPLDHSGEQNEFDGASGDNNQDSGDDNDHNNNDDDDDNDADDDENNNPLRQRLLPVSAHPDPTRLPTRYSTSSNARRHIKCMMRTCGAWYTFTVIGAIFFVTSSILLFPKVPEVNVCSDEVAWKSIIDGLTSLKVEASFEILTSVKNKNRLDIALQGVAGKFRHDGQEVGTFEVKPTTIAASSISDVLVTCTVFPDRWEALGLVADYYKGTLQFLVDVSGSIRIKEIGFSIPVKMTDILVKANKNVTKKDRYLCACPQWKDLHPTPSPVLSFEEAIVDPVKTSHLNESSSQELLEMDSW